MTAREVRDILDAEVLTGEDLLDTPLKTACGSDMMSEVLAYSHEHALLLTGLCNQQAIRTAEMMDIKCLCYVRGKVPAEDLVEMAKDRDIIVMTTKHGLFVSCGLLYQAGMSGGEG